MIRDNYWNDIKALIRKYLNEKMRYKGHTSNPFSIFDLCNLIVLSSQNIIIF